MTILIGEHHLIPPPSSKNPDYMHASMQGYAFPLINHEAYAAKVCTLWLYMPEVYVHAYCVLELLMARHMSQLQGNIIISLTMTSRDMRFPPCHVLYEDS